MSRYAQRLAPPAANRYRQPQNRGYYDEEPPHHLGRGYRDEPQEDDDDDETAVATDLSLARQHQPHRGVQFGENEVEEFNGSEAPDAVLPARSRSRMALSPPPPIPPPTGRRSAQPAPPPPALVPALVRPPPPQQQQRQRLSEARYDMPPPPVPDRGRGRYDAPVSFARSTAYADEPPRRERSWADYGDDMDDEPAPHEVDGDDDDAFTAVATGVATDLSMDDGPPSQSRRAEDPRARIAAAQAQALGQGPSFLAVPRPPSRGVQVRRASPDPQQHPQSQALAVQPPPAAARYSPSGFDEDDFSASGVDDDAPPYFAPAQGRRASSQQHQQGQLPPPPVAPVQRTYVSSAAAGIGRPVSSTSSRMRVDDDDDDEGFQPPMPPARAPPRAVAYERPAVASRDRERERDEGSEDSPLERELIALLKDLNFSLALKDFHDAMRIGVQKTLVSEDGMGHAYVKIHVQRLPRVQDLTTEEHLQAFWVPLAGSRWEFRTPSHSVTVVFKTAALAAYEAQFLTSRR